MPGTVLIKLQVFVLNGKGKVVYFSDVFCNSCVDLGCYSLIKFKETLCLKPGKLRLK